MDLVDFHSLQFCVCNAWVFFPILLTGMCPNVVFYVVIVNSIGIIMWFLMVACVVLMF